MPRLPLDVVTGADIGNPDWDQLLPMPSEHWVAVGKGVEGTAVRVGHFHAKFPEGRHETHVREPMVGG